MTLTIILGSILVATILGFIRNRELRTYLLLGTSAVAVYAFQPTLPIRSLDFYLPTLTLTLAVFGWIITAPNEIRTWRKNWRSITILLAVIFMMGLIKYLGFNLPFFPSQPPQLYVILSILVMIIFFSFILTKIIPPVKTILVIATFIILLLFLIIKIPFLSLNISIFLRFISGQTISTASSLATSFDIRWLGYSYIAFRLLHTIRDRQSGRLPNFLLSEYVNFIIFFPALSAGPIDRIERFVGDLRQPFERKEIDWISSCQRIVIGLFKKFVVADSLALVALNSTNALQVQSSVWAWIMLYAYAFQLYLDFSGYTDIAIGTGKLLGVTLPENFKSPYWKSNLTLFWNNWHMTLTQWFRAYFFNPITRALRSGKRLLPVALIIFITQITTMVLIGLWHGASMNFIIWGFMHGIGLFLHNRWSDFLKVRFTSLPVGWQKIFNMGGTIITFHFILFSWIFFALPSLGSSWHYFRVIFGLT